MRVADEYQVFFQSILGRETLRNWDEMWAALKQEELRRDLIKANLDKRSSRSGLKPKEKEDNSTLASNGQQGKQRRKKDISKVKCFICGDMGHYAS